MSSAKKVSLTYHQDTSALGNLRRSTPCALPQVLERAPHISYSSHEALGAVDDHDLIESMFPHSFGGARIALEKIPEAERDPSKDYNVPLRIAVVLSGGQAPGGHNVICGVYAYAKSISPDSEVLGFLDGPQGIYNGKYTVIDEAMMNNYYNTGGFDMICAGRHKIEKPSEFQASLEVCTELNLDGVVIIGGDDSNTNAAVLAEYFAAHGCKTRVCGAPKTIDGDLKVHPYIPISFGFDTACRSYSELIGNLGQDTLSSQKYYHFVRLMGRAASNIALECALQTRPNVCLISEEVAAKKMTLADITNEIVKVVVARARQGKHYGLVLLPEGLIEFIPEFEVLINEINDILACPDIKLEENGHPSEETVTELLSFNSRAVFSYVPANIKQQLLLDRDPHGNVQVAKIETEKLLAQTVAMELHKIRLLHSQSEDPANYCGEFNPQFHSFGYEGRSGFPSDFDATYCFALGQTVAAMVSLGLNGMIASVTNLTAPVGEWHCGGVPITMMCHMEKRAGHFKPVIKKALVELDGQPFQCFAAQRSLWALHDLYRSPGPLQFCRYEDSGCSLSTQSRVDLCITLTLELCKTDSRMELDENVLQELTPSQQREAGLRYGCYMHNTHANVGPKRLMSDLQQQRMTYKPKLCRAFSDTAGSTCVLGQATQCRRVQDRGLIQTHFPNTYGSQLVSITAVGDAPEAVEKTATPAQPTCAITSTEYTGPLRVGVVFCGRQAPGGHDVISGLFDTLSGGAGTVVGFVGGTDGLIANHAVEITAETLATFRGQGGYELLSRSKDTINSSSYAAVLDSCKDRNLHGLVLIGGAKTSTNAAYLAEWLVAQGSTTKIITVPVDTAGSLKDEFIETTVGFDTATKTAAQVVGNNATDGASARKYYYFMRLMGQEPSHAALEVGLATRPNYVVLAEEVEQRHLTLADIVRGISDMVVARAAQGKNYGTVLIPEGLMDSIPELVMLNNELDNLYRLEQARNPAATTGTTAAAATVNASVDGASHDHSNNGARSTAGGVARGTGKIGHCLDSCEIRNKLTQWSRALLDSLPEFMQVELLHSRGGEENTIKLSQAETERLVAHFVAIELNYRKAQGTYTGSFNAICSYIGYQARGAIPSNFDVNYAYNLGFAAVSLVRAGFTGYMAVINKLKQPVSEWTAGGVPITALLSHPMNAATARAKDGRSLQQQQRVRPVVRKATVDLTGPAYLALSQIFEAAASDSSIDRYTNPGPLQFSGPVALTDSVPHTLSLETYHYWEDLQLLHDALAAIERTCRPGCPSAVLQITTKSLANLTEVIRTVSENLADNK